MVAAQPQEANKHSSGETFLMIDTCAGASVFPKNFDKRAVKDDAVPKTALITATNAAVKTAGGKRSTYTLRNGAGVAVKYNEANVSFPIVSVGEAIVQGSWFVFGPGGQAMISADAGTELEKLVRGPAAVQLLKKRGVYWLPCTTSDKQDGVHAPLGEVRKEADDNEAPLEVADGMEQGIAQGSAAEADTQPLKARSSGDYLKLDENDVKQAPSAAMPLKAGSASSPSHLTMDESKDDTVPKTASTTVTSGAVEKRNVEPPVVECVEAPYSSRADVSLAVNDPRPMMWCDWCERTLQPRDACTNLCTRCGWYFCGWCFWSHNCQPLNRRQLTDESDVEEAPLAAMPLKASPASRSSHMKMDASDECQKQTEILRSRLEEVYKQPMNVDHVVFPWLVRHGARQSTHY